MINPVAAVTRLRVMGPAYFPTGIRERIPRPRSRVLLVAAIVFFVVSNAFNVFLGYLIVNGSLDDKWYDFRDLGIGMRELTAWLDTQNASLPSGFDSVGFLGDHWMSYIATGFIGAFAILNFIGIVLLILVWTERRLLARIQVRRTMRRGRSAARASPERIWLRMRSTGSGSKHGLVMASRNRSKAMARVSVSVPSEPLKLSRPAPKPMDMELSSRRC